MNREERVDGSSFRWLEADAMQCLDSSVLLGLLVRSLARQ